MKTNTSHPAESYHSATGTIRYTFTNDLMFKISFQDQQILAEFLAALLHLPHDKIKNVSIKNPYKPGDAIDDKTLVMDIDLILNGDIRINIELQVINYSDWPDRSLTYLCREFDQLCHGEEYNHTKQCLHISILDFTLFSEYPEFYSKYMLLNVKNHNIYNDKFCLHVLDLKQISLATEEDRLYQLDKWAMLFKATTWEEIKHMANENPIFDKMAQNLYTANADEQVRKVCQQRADYELYQRRTQERIADFERYERRTQERIADFERYERRTQEMIADFELRHKQSQEMIADFELRHKQSQEMIAQQDLAIAEKDAKIAALEALLAQREL